MSCWVFELMSCWVFESMIFLVWVCFFILSMRLWVVRLYWIVNGFWVVCPFGDIRFVWLCTNLEGCNRICGNCHVAVGLFAGLPLCGSREKGERFVFVIRRRCSLLKLQLGFLNLNSVSLQIPSALFGRHHWLAFVGVGQCIALLVVG